MKSICTFSPAPSVCNENMNLLNTTDIVGNSLNIRQITCFLTVSSTRSPGECGHPAEPSHKGMQTRRHPKPTVSVLPGVRPPAPLRAHPSHPCPVHTPALVKCRGTVVGMCCPPNVGDGAVRTAPVFTCSLSWVWQKPLLRPHSVAPGVWV